MEVLQVNSVKKVNLLLCLIFSFIFLFSNVFSVQAATDVTNIHLYENQLEQPLYAKYPNDEVAVCKFSYITVNNGEQEIIWRIQDIDGWIKNNRHPDIYHYRLLGRKSNYEISEDGTSVKIFVTMERYKEFFIFPFREKEFNLTFEFKVN